MPGQSSLLDRLRNNPSPSSSSYTHFTNTTTHSSPAAAAALKAFCSGPSLGPGGRSYYTRVPVQDTGSTGMSSQAGYGYGNYGVPSSAGSAYGGGGGYGAGPSRGYGSQYHHQQQQQRLSRFMEADSDNDSPLAREALRDSIESNRVYPLPPQGKLDSSYKKLKKSKSVMLVRRPGLQKAPSVAALQAKENLKKEALKNIENEGLRGPSNSTEAAPRIKVRKSESFLRGGRDFMPGYMRDEVERKEARRVGRRKSLYFAMWGKENKKLDKGKEREDQRQEHDDYVESLRDAERGYGFSGRIGGHQLDDENESVREERPFPTEAPFNRPPLANYGSLNNKPFGSLRTHGSLRVKARQISSSFYRSVRGVFKPKSGPDGAKGEMPPQQVASKKDYHFSYDSPAEALSPEDRYEEPGVRRMRIPSFRYKPSMEFLKMGSARRTSNPWAQEEQAGSNENASSTWGRRDGNLMSRLEENDIPIVDEERNRNEKDENDDKVPTDIPEIAGKKTNTLQRSATHSKVFASLLRKVGRRGSTPALENTFSAPPPPPPVTETDEETLDLPSIPPSGSTRQVDGKSRRSFSFSSTIRRVSPSSEADSDAVHPPVPPLPNILPPPPPPPLPPSFNSPRTQNQNLTENTRPGRTATPLRLPTPCSAKSTPNRRRAGQQPRGSTFFPSGMGKTPIQSPSAASGNGANTPSPFKRALAQLQQHVVGGGGQSSPSIYSQPGRSCVNTPATVASFANGRDGSPMSKRGSVLQQSFSPNQTRGGGGDSTNWASPSSENPFLFTANKKDSSNQNSPNTSTAPTQKLRIVKRKGSIGTAALLTSAASHLDKNSPQKSQIPSRLNEMFRATTLGAGGGAGSASQQSSYTSRFGSNAGRNKGRGWGACSADWGDELSGKLEKVNEERRVVSGGTVGSEGSSVRFRSGRGRRGGSVCFL